MSVLIILKTVHEAVQRLAHMPREPEGPAPLVGRIDMPHCQATLNETKRVPVRTCPRGTGLNGRLAEVAHFQFRHIKVEQHVEKRTRHPFFPEQPGQGAPLPDEGAASR